jgi:hypothetical protein
MTTEDDGEEPEVLTKQDFEALARFRFAINRYLRFSEETVRRDGPDPATISATAGAQGVPWPGLGDRAGVSRPATATSPQRGRTGQPSTEARARAADNASKRRAGGASATDTAGRASTDTRQRAAPRRVVADGHGTHPPDLGQHAGGRARYPFMTPAHAAGWPVAGTCRRIPAGNRQVSRSQQGCFHTMTPASTRQHEPRGRRPATVVQPPAQP